MLTVNALAAADTTLIPVQAQYLSAKGLEQLLQTVQKVRRQINPKLKIEGIENEQLLTALETLKVEDLEIITMYAYEGYDITEISKVYGVSRPTISIKIKRITKFLKNFNFNATN